MDADTVTLSKGGGSFVFPVQLDSADIAVFDFVTEASPYIVDIDIDSAFLATFAFVFLYIEASTLDTIYRLILANVFTFLTIHYGHTVIVCGCRYCYFI